MLLQLVSLKDAAEALGVSRSTLWRLMRAGRIPAVTIGSRRLVRHEHLVSYVESQTLARRQRG